VSQRNGGVGNLTFALTPRPAYKDTSGFPLALTSLKPEATRSVFPRLIDRNNDFWWLPRQPDLTPAKDFDKAYDVRLADKIGRVCIVRNVEVKDGAVFSIEERQLTDCRR
jgi:hypothetical protein